MIQQSKSNGDNANVNVVIEINLSLRVLTTSPLRGKHSQETMYKYTPEAMDKMIPSVKSQTETARTTRPPTITESPDMKFSKRANNG
mmetsp:Transcript_11395/g.21321  ORF Transcript_11395/g.21321 Transcript_11395/m.21321 type:complete len:87 (-) Transcript_11395:1156-1416(-)